MIKKILALAATSLLSLNATAGYVQYNFEGDISGYIVQHDDDGSIADFRFSMFFHGLPSDPFHYTFWPAMGEGSTSLTTTVNRFNFNGPSDYVVNSDFGADQYTSFDIFFRRSTEGTFAYTAHYDTSVYFWDGFHPASGTARGRVTKGAVDPYLAQWLDYNGGYTDGVSPSFPTRAPNNRVPEPAGIALLAIGALGACAAARRRRPAR